MEFNSDMTYRFKIPILGYTYDGVFFYSQPFVDDDFFLVKIYESKISIQNGTVNFRMERFDKLGNISRNERPYKTHIKNLLGEFWFHETGVFHREVGPAIILFNGVQIWIHNGKLHRIDGPAIIDAKNDSWIYYHHGLKHRIDGPAVQIKTSSELSTAWYFDDKVHCDNDRPAICRILYELDGRVSRDISYSWWQHGNLYRFGDGPSYIAISEDDIFNLWINDNKYSIHKPVCIRYDKYKTITHVHYSVDGKEESYPSSSK